jgi:hypothetical protein
MAGKKDSITKIQDTFNDKKSKADQYWTGANLQRFYRTFRKPMILPTNYVEDVNSVERVSEIFKIRGFQFGNWVTTEDRFNYLAAMYICLYDLQRVVKFNSNNLGLNNRLAIAFGSRGNPGALAHYEPVNIVINISRYKREDVLKKMIEATGTKPPAHIPKEVLFLETGGIGSFAHEYGHFLDGVYGLYSEPKSGLPYLTGKRGSVDKERVEYPATNVLRNLVEDFFQTVFWTATKKKTKFSLRLEATKSDYLQNRQEIFARCFEQYIDYKLQKIKIKNEFMVKRKYAAKHYLTDTELKKVVPIFDKLISRMRMLS